MRDHHRIWIESHPHWSAEMLQQALHNGFDIHHVDGDHDNNTSDNLVLIEHTDHMMLHNGRRFLLHDLPRKPPGPHRKTLERGEAAYGLREQGWTWPRIERELDHHGARANARTFAKHTGRAWPIIIGNEP